MSAKQPPEILEALEALENASAPDDLGAPYQVLLDWRRRHPLGTFAQRFGTAFFALFLFTGISLSLVMTRYITPQNQEFWNGVLWGVLGTNFIHSVARLAAPKPPPTIDQRIEEAIAYWRHLTPRMREIPT